MQQGALATAGFTHQRQAFALCQMQIDTTQNIQRSLCRGVALEYVSHLQHEQPNRSDRRSRVAPELVRVAGRCPLSCDAPRRHAVQDALRPLFDAERRELYSHAGA